MHRNNPASWCSALNPTETGPSACRLKSDTRALPSPAHVYCVDIGPTGNWGRPLGPEAWTRFYRYPLAIWDEPFFRQPDVVLIDGRFRPACLMAVLLRTQKPVTVLFNDYTERPTYHSVEAFLKPTETVGRMAVFEVHPRPFDPSETGAIMDHFFRATYHGAVGANYRVFPSEYSEYGELGADGKIKNAWQKQKKPNLKISFPQTIRPFALGENEQNDLPSLDQRRIGTMASFPQRQDSLKAVVTYILPQLDELRIYLNDYEEVPGFLDKPKIKVTLSKDAEGDLRDNGKFHRVPAEDNCYVFSLDDDLAYPPDYVAKMIHHIEMLGRSCIVGVHGVIFPAGEFSRLRQRTVYHFRDRQLGHFVDLLGTGTAAWHSSTFAPALEDFRSKGVCDLWFAAAAANHNIPMFSIPRQENWLREHASHEVGLYKETLSQPQGYFETYLSSISPALQNGRLRREMNAHLSRCYDSDSLGAASIEIPGLCCKKSW